MVSLLILRHGPTHWNAEKRVQGHTDIALSPLGCEEVRNWAVPEEYKNFHCVSSPLVRAVETAKLLGLDPEPAPAICEMSWGAWEGHTLADLREELGQAMSDNEALGLDFLPVGGESPRMVQDRLRPWLKTLTKPTIAVCHKGVIRALYAIASGWDMREKSKTKLIDKRAHLFKIDENGRVIIDRLNIELATGGAL